MFSHSVAARKTWCHVVTAHTSRVCRYRKRKVSGVGGAGLFLIVFPFPIKQHTRHNTRGEDQNLDYNITLFRVMALRDNNFVIFLLSPRAQRRKIFVRRIVRDRLPYAYRRGSGRDDKEDALSMVCTVCVLALARRVFGKLPPPQPVECVKMGLQLRVRGGGARGGLEMTGGMDGRLVVVWWWRRRDDEEKKRKRPRSHGSVSGAPVSVCVYVFLSDVVSVVRVCVKGRGQGIPYLFFSSLLFSFYRRRRNHRTPTTPDDDDTEHLLSLLSPDTVYKRDAPAAA